MFHKSAQFYDLIYRELKDYADEAKKLDYLLSLMEPKPRRILDVGCGTGEHAKYLSEQFGYTVDGIDIEPELIQIASQKLPQADLTVADMRSFELPAKYDAILCLFSSIGYVETLANLESTFVHMAKHLEPGGWLICEPWAQPENWREGQIDAIEATDPETGESVTRTRMGATEGSVSVLKIEYDIQGPDGDRQLTEEHRLGLFSKDQMIAALELAGFEARGTDTELQSDYLIVATYVP